MKAKLIFCPLVVLVACLASSANGGQLGFHPKDELSQEQIEAYARVQELFRDVDRQIGATNEPEKFVAAASRGMQMALEQCKADHLKPESSKTGEARGQSIELMNRLVSAYRSAIAGDSKELAAESALIGARSEQIARLHRRDLSLVDKYLTALFDTVQRVERDRQQRSAAAGNNGGHGGSGGGGGDGRTEGPGWLQRILRNCGLDC